MPRFEGDDMRTRAGLVAITSLVALAGQAAAQTPSQPPPVSAASPAKPPGLWDVSKGMPAVAALKRISPALSWIPATAQEHGRIAPAHLPVLSLPAPPPSKTATGS